MIETAAERYRKIKAEREVNIEIFDFTSPSGMEWKLRRPDLGKWVTQGMMPVSLAAKGAKISATGATGIDPATLDIDELINSIDFAQKVVRWSAVSPKIVEHPTEGADEIGYDEVELDDFNAIFAWAMPGGGKAESLDNFPGEQE